MKTCTKCGVLKPVTEFYKQGNSSGSYRSHCKKCCCIAPYSGSTSIRDKICTVCNESQLISNFPNKKTSKDGYNTICRKCVNSKRNVYRTKNKIKINTQQRRWRRDNKKWLGDWYADNLDTIRVNRMRNQRKRLLDPLEALKSRIRKSILHTFHVRGFTKKSKTVNILGCSFDEFKAHLESQFEPWMNWENRGLYNGELNYGWDIDHIIPLSSAITEEDIIRLNHYTNLQPLCSYINRVVKRHYQH